MNEMVTDGSWPECVTVNGPTVRRNCATVFNGICLPLFDLT